MQTKEEGQCLDLTTLHIIKIIDLRILRYYSFQKDSFTDRYSGSEGGG